MKTLRRFTYASRHGRETFKALIPFPAREFVISKIRAAIGSILFCLNAARSLEQWKVAPSLYSLYWLDKCPPCNVSQFPFVHVHKVA